MNIQEQICCGCGACIEQCPVNSIRMYRDEAGFFKAIVDPQRCVQCGKCTSVCTMNRPGDSHRRPIEAYAAYHQDPAERQQSSSGGLFPAIAGYVLRVGGIVFGAAFDQKMHLHHVQIASKEELPLLRGSKYLQSDISDVYQRIREQLAQGKIIYFTGTPCEVAALYTVLGERPDNLITSDLICHGAPSSGLFEAYLRYMEERKNTSIVDYCFRCKEKANARMSYTTKIRMKHDQTEKMEYIDGDEDPYILRFISNALQCESCYQCPFASLSRVGDLTLGDYWGYEEAHHELADVSGVSLVLANTIKGIKLLHELKEVVYVTTTEDKYLKKNKHLVKPPVKHKDRDELYREFARYGFTRQFYENTFLPRGYRLYIMKRRIRSLLR